MGKRKARPEESWEQRSYEKIELGSRRSVVSLALLRQKL